MTRIDDPLGQIEQQKRYDEFHDSSKAISTTLNVAAPIMALLVSPPTGAVIALAKFSAQFYADSRKQARADAFQTGLRDGVNEAIKRLDTIERKVSGPDAEEAITTAIKVALQSARLDKARLAGRILGGTLAQDEPRWNEAAEFIRALEDFTDDDVKALRIIWDVQKSAWQPVKAGDQRREMSTDANSYTKEWKDILEAADRSAISRDDWYSRCARLSGFGLALQVQPNLAFQGPDAVCYRLTGRAARLMQLLGVFVDPRQYPKVKYHRSKPSCTVRNPEEERGLGPDWADSPNTFR